MNSLAEDRGALFQWVLRKGRGVDPTTLTGSTPLLDGRHLNSLHIPDLLLFIEQLRGRPVDISRLRAGDFRDLDTICARFLAGDHKEHARP